MFFFARIISVGKKERIIEFSNARASTHVRIYVEICFANRE